MDIDEHPSFASLLKEYRLARGLSQEALAEQSGLSREAVSLLERGLRLSPYRDTVIVLAHTLKLSSDEQAQLVAAASRQRRRAHPVPRDDATSPASLPVRLTSFVGREREIADVQELLRAKRMLTLTGPGGIGKTSLALAVAEAMHVGFADGAALVDVAPLSDGELVPHTIAAVLGVRERPGEPILTTLGTALGASQRLVVLDNCEHLLLSCARVVEALLRASPRLRILATSREPLRIGAEVVWRVPSLTLPDEDDRSLSEFPKSEAVRLFVERAEAVQPGFQLTTRNAAAVNEICRRLDGIPLAIELAAARVAGLSPEQIAQHLNDRFRLLTTGSRTALPRHQTLRALIDWSYDLLSEPERVLFRRLAVFASSFTMEAAEWLLGVEDQVARGGKIETRPLIPDTRLDVPDLLLGLVDQSLVLVEERNEEARFGMLETIRAYGLGVLVASGEARSVAERHAGHYVVLVDEATRRYTSEGPGSRTGWDTRLQSEQDNLRAALAWCRDNDPSLGLRLAAGLGWFWVFRRSLTEGEGWLASFLAQTAGEPGLRGRALLGLATLKRDRGELAAAQPLFEESLALCRQVRDQWGIARCLIMLAHQARSASDYALAVALAQESLAMARELRVDDSIIWALYALAQVHRGQGDSGRARAALEEVMRRWPGEFFPFQQLGLIAEEAGDYARAEVLYREGHDRWQPWKTPTVWFGYYLSRIARKRGDRVRARRFVEEELAIAGPMGDPVACFALFQLAELDWADDDPISGHARLAEGLRVAQRLGSRQHVVFGLLVRARHAFDLGELSRAARLFGAADAAVPLFRFEWDGVEFTDYERALTEVRAEFTPNAFASAWTEGQAMTLEQAIAYASDY